MSTPFALNLAAAPLVSGLPVAPQDLSTGAIDPHALSELVSRSATFESKPIAIPECARKPLLDERPKIRNDIQIWELAKSVFTTFGNGVLEEHVGPRRKIDWKQVRKMRPERYPVREGRSKRDHGKMVELESDDCSDASEQEEEEEPDEMIDDFDTEEELAAAARKAAKKARKE